MKKILTTLVLSLTFISFLHASNFDPLLASRLQNLTDSLRLANNIKGISVCVLHPQQGRWQGVSGISHQGTPIDSNMLFGIGSNTKLFTGVLMLKLMQSGLIQLDDSLHQWLPAYTNINPNISIRQLLNHRSGLADINSIPGYPDSILSNPYRIFTPQEVLTWVGTPLFPPGNAYSYCNTNYILAGLIAEIASGQSYVQLLHDSILNPLQLDSTFLGAYDSISYPLAQPWQGSTNNFPVSRNAVNSVSWASGGMVSTASEMAQWYQALMNGEVLQQNAFAEMTTFTGSAAYGIGLYQTVINNRVVWQHGGSIWGGYNSSMMYDTSSGIIVAVMVNQNPGQAFSIASQLLMETTNFLVGSPELSNNKKTVMLFPNPANNKLCVYTNENLQTINIFNFRGEKLMESNSKQIDVSNLSCGMYFLQIVTVHGVQTCSFIRQ
jgi:D-alanyl-D-alanine carboxypeptidase